MPWYEWFKLVGGPAIACAAILAFTRFIYKLIKERKNETVALMNAINDLKTEKNEINTGLATLQGNVGIIKDHLDAHSQGLQSLLRDRLMQSFRYFEEKGWASQPDKENVTNMYNQYENLGVNGVMTARYENFLKLPFSPPRTGDDNHETR